MFGPPGTGKTTWLAASVNATAKARGTSRLVVASFTRASAAEIGGRKLPLDKSQVGTLHSLAYRAIGRPAVAEESLDEWNRANKGAWALSAGFRTMDESPVEWRGATDGDRMMARLETYRARMRSRDVWPTEVLRFDKRWSEWKAANGLVDFTDMIERALDTESAPGDPLVGWFDECQDFTPLELRLVRHWGARMERLIMAGDDDQVLYSFKGATPDAFLDPPVPDSQKRVLTQSYRVPRAVHALSQRWVRHLTRREEKEYLPRDHDGRVRGLPYDFQNGAEQVVRDVSRQVEEGRTVMIIASCGYMLDRVKHTMRDAGLPYHNPKRRSRSDWNPLRASRGVSMSDRLLSYLIIDERVFGELSRLWTGHDVKRWSHVLRKQGVFKRGARDAVDGLPDRELRFEELAALFESDEELERAATPDLEWFANHLTAGARPTMTFPVRVAQRHGPLALVAEPKVKLGTIHCSPPDELILTSRGEVSIGDLTEDDGLVSYTRLTNRVRGNNARHGFPFSRSVRDYDGPLVVIETEVSKTKVTPNHRVLVKFGEDFLEKWVVYLMRRGPWWRIGVCTSAHRPYRSGGVGGRLATEQGDAGWILGVYETRKEALVAEMIFQGGSGIPGFTFESYTEDRLLAIEEMHAVHEKIADDVGPRVKTLLWSLGLSEEWPLYTRSSPNGVGRRGSRTDGDLAKRNMRGWFVTEAANLVSLSGYVSMATVNDSQKPAPAVASVSTESYEGPVYGLDVPPHHYYVSGGAVVHNSFKGDQAEVVYVAPDLSPSGMREWGQRGEARDSVIRLFYVAMTRAQEELVVCQRSGPLGVPQELLLRGGR